jgi:uncharacterized protein YcfL
MSSRAGSKVNQPMGLLHRARLLAGVALAALLLAGCGSNGGSLLSNSERSQLDSQISRISADLSAGNCTQAEDDIVTLQNDVAGLQGINTTLYSMISNAASQVQSLSETDCPTTSTTTATNTSTQTTTTATQASVTTATIVTQTSVTTPPVTTASTPTTGSDTQPSGGAGLLGGNIVRGRPRSHEYGDRGRGRR